ncbi:MAG: hypothetical protein U5L95_02085 [Candidatus Saccharibacteria bacterium]|nr:hypothetical protein [Candidatus Saccharibacteria bacterium]
MTDYGAFDKKYPVSTSLRKYFRLKTANHNHKNNVVKYLFGAAIIIGIIVLVAPFVFLLGAVVSGEVPLPLFLFIVMIPLLMILSFGYNFYVSGKRALLIERFCKDNDFRYDETLTVNNEQGILFQKGRSRKASHGITGHMNDRPFSVFDYQYTTGSGKNKKTSYFTTVKITLDKTLPHILLDNKKDGSVGSMDFDRSQQLELEGDFNKYFNVFGPKEYEIEVLQILNPSVMQTLIDLHEPADIEIYKNALYVYDGGRRYNEKKLRALFTIMEEVLGSTASVRRSFSMAQQIGPHRPILKRAKWPAIITGIGIALFVAAQAASIFFD